jgi:hypothetical protein
MDYITHTKYRGLALTGEKTFIPRGKKLQREGNVLFFMNQPICIYRSECARKHFAVNEDNQGLVRGDIIHNIAYSGSRTNVNGWLQRFNEKQIEILTSDKWNKFIDPEHDVIIFTDAFFEADPEELKELQTELNQYAS